MIYSHIDLEGPIGLIQRQDLWAETSLQCLLIKEDYNLFPLSLSP